jgi:hypothetical protein
LGSIIQLDNLDIKTLHIFTLVTETGYGLHGML